MQLEIKKINKVLILYGPMVEQEDTADHGDSLGIQ